jgi:hypothetical protein
MLLSGRFHASPAPTVDPRVGLRSRLGGKSSIPTWNGSSVAWCAAWTLQWLQLPTAVKNLVAVFLQTIYSFLTVGCCHVITGDFRKVHKVISVHMFHEWSRNYQSGTVLQKMIECKISAGPRQHSDSWFRVPDGSVSLQSLQLFSHMFPTEELTGNIQRCE